jgi:polynucleotide 5'-kinase involved in rRNA processing
MNNGHELRLDLARARQRELIVAGERARMDARSSQSGDERADAMRPSSGKHRSRAVRRARLIGLMLRRARLSAVREQGPC